MQLDDPSLQNNYVQLFQTQKSVSISTANQQLTDYIMFRLFKNTMGYKLQLTSESNISFFYYLEITQFNFNKLSKDNQLNIMFDDFGHWLSDLLANKLSQKNNQLTYKLNIKSKVQAKLLILKQQAYKVYQFVRFDMIIGNEKMLRESLMYRYQRMKARKLMLTEYLQNMENIVKTKNPSLLLDLNRVPTRKTPFK